MILFSLNHQPVQPMRCIILLQKEQEHITKSTLKASPSAELVSFIVCFLRPEEMHHLEPGRGRPLFLWLSFLFFFLFFSLTHTFIHLASLRATGRVPLLSIGRRWLSSLFSFSAWWGPCLEAAQLLDRDQHRQREFPVKVSGFLHSIIPGRGEVISRQQRLWFKPHFWCRGRAGWCLFILSSFKQWLSGCYRWRS